MNSTGAYPHAPGFKTTGTSEEAARAEAGRARTLRDEVLRALRSAELTADQCAALLGESVLSVRPRLSELVKLGRIEYAGLRRRNASGHSAAVWRVTRPAALAQGLLL